MRSVWRLNTEAQGRLPSEIFRAHTDWQEAIKMLQDIKFAWRRILKNPTFTFIAVITLALGIGANTAIFSVVNSVLLRPLPYHEPDRLLRVWPNNLYSKGVFSALRDNQSLESLAAFTIDSGFNLTGYGEAERIKGSATSSEFFVVLGVQPVLGRTFRSGEDLTNQSQVVILSHALWQQRFGKEPSIIGRTIMLDGQSREVVGVMPPDFYFPSRETRLWVPLSFDPKNFPDYWALTPLSMIGRLRPGGSVEQATAELQKLVPQIRSTLPWRMPDDWGITEQVVPLQRYLVGDLQPRLLILLGAVLLVLLIACVNVANLLLASAFARQKEIALRVALGATRWKIIRQLLTESIFIALLGGALGLLVAHQGLRVLLAILPADRIDLTNIVIDWRVLSFTAALGVLTGLIFGLIPALQTSTPDLQQALKDGGARVSGVGTESRNLTSWLVVGQVALAVVVIASAGLLMRSFWRLSQADTGFHSENLTTCRVTVTESKYKDTAQRVAFYDELLPRLRALPSVRGASAVNSIPLSGTATIIPLVARDHPLLLGSSPPEAQMFVVTPEYTSTMGIQILKGRALTDADRGSGTGAVLVSQSLVNKIWPGEDAVGKLIKPVHPKEWWTVVGVVSDVEQHGLTKTSNMQFYIPYGTFDAPAAMDIVISTSGDPSLVTNNLRSIVSSVDRDVPISNVRTIEDVVSAAISAPRFTTWLLSAFALLALVLGASGIYSLVSYSVTARTHEMGVRLALGAKPSAILRLVMLRALGLTLIGIVIGVAATLGIARLLQGLLYQVSSADPLTIMVVVAIIVVVTLLASYLPARRAARIDPVIAMRNEI